MAQRQAFITLDGFDDLIRRIEKAGGTIDEAVGRCCEESAEAQQAELKSAMARKGVSSKLIGRMPTLEIERDGNRVTVRVGFKKGKYDPKNLSDGYKAVFINYGTPRIKPRGFVETAKKKARPKIKKKQEEALQAILKELGG